MSKGRRPGKPRRSFTFIDLFAGIGGMRIAFESAGGECVFSSEWDKYAQRTYEWNFGETPHGDITQIEAEVIPDFDVLLAGFPCQPFSSIGRREGFGHPTQGTLFHDIVRILREKEPKTFLLENVEGLETHDNGNTIRVIEEALRGLGYVIDRRVLDAADYGVPQHRRRTYIVGFHGEICTAEFPMTWPKQMRSQKGVGSIIERGVKGHSISKHLQRVYIYKKNDGRPEVVDCHSTEPVKTLCASYHKIQRLTGTFVRDGETGLRLLTANECKGIMGFPSWFEIPQSVSRTQMYRQFGNSVAVPVVKRIAKAMSECISSADAKPVGSDMAKTEVLQSRRKSVA
jgi:DNA (cytosine-5)-methyltransferase 1